MEYLWIGFMFALGMMLAAGLVRTVRGYIQHRLDNPKPPKPVPPPDAPKWENGFVRSFRNIFG